VVVGVAVAFGCAGEQASTNRYGVVHRLIPEVPSRTFERASSLDFESEVLWRFDSPGARAPWVLRDLEHLTRAGGGLTLRAGRPRPMLDRETSLDADLIQVLELSIAGLRKGRLEFFWAGPGENFSSKRRLTHDVLRATGGRLTSIRLDLLSHADWSGRIARVRLVLPATPGRTVRLEELRWFSATVDDARLAELTRESWNVELGSDSRPALLCPPGTIIERKLDLPAAPMLSFSFGLDPAVDRSIAFKVSIAEEGEPFSQVFNGSLHPQAGQTDRWFSRTLPLSGFSGRRVRLRLETSSESGGRPDRAFAAWSNVEILAPPAAGELEPAPNVVVILLDTLRADRLSCYGNPRMSSPNIDRWAESSAVIFENVVAPAPWTLPSHVSLFTGLDAVGHGVNHSSLAPPELSMMAELIRGRGYTTGAVTGGVYLRPTFGLAQGFDSFRFWPDVDRKDELKDGIERALVWLDEHHDRQFFLFFHTYEVHGPHRRRQPHFDRMLAQDPVALTGTRIQSRAYEWDGPRSRGEYFVSISPETGNEVAHLTGDEKRLLRGMYDSAIGYADAQVRRLLDRLDDLGLRDTTMVVLTSDHGEALGERDRAGHRYLNEYNLLVPLIIELPGRAGRGTRVSDQVRLIDVLPTVLEAVGLQPPTPIDGRSLLPLVRGDRPPVSRDAWSYGSSDNLGLALRVENRLKYVFNNSAWTGLLGEEELYDLEDDPIEEVNLAPGHAATEELRRRTRDFILSRHRGVRLEIRNATHGVLEGSLRGSLARVSSVKSVDSKCRCVNWEEGQGATFSVAAGERMTLLFEELNSGSTTVSGTLTGLGGGRGHDFVDSFDLQSLGVGVGLAFADNGWARCGSEADVETGFWFGPAGMTNLAHTGVERSDELLDQLRALGYVE
jgi:arylsulfatase A-like enzyme